LRAAPGQRALSLTAPAAGGVLRVLPEGVGGRVVKVVAAKKRTWGELLPSMTRKDSEDAEWRTGATPDKT